MQQHTYFLSSLDSVRLEEPRECIFERLLVFDTGKPIMEAHIDPPVIGQDLGRTEDIRLVLLAARHEDAGIDAINSFPCFVFVAIARGMMELQSPVRADELQVVGWGELYRTHEDAASHRFG